MLVSQCDTEPNSDIVPTLYTIFSINVLGQLLFERRGRLGAQVHVLYIVSKNTQVYSSGEAAEVVKTYFLALYLSPMQPRTNLLLWLRVMNGERSSRLLVLFLFCDMKDHTE